MATKKTADDALREALDDIEQPLVVVDAHGTIVHVGSPAERHFARPAVELVGLKVEELLPGLQTPGRLQGARDRDDRVAVAAALRQALERDELSLVFQPQIDLESGCFAGVEALARWNSPVLGVVPPARFIPIAEENGQILELGRWVLRTACVRAAELSARLDSPVRVAVNVSPRQLRRREWLAEVVAAIEMAGISPGQLEIELTEGALVDDSSEVIGMLETLRRLGVTIAIDDFGRGYSSLAYLSTLPIDKVKIDRRFVAQILDADDTAPIVDAIIAMAHAMNMTVVAEGVEDRVHEDYLRRQGCDEVQGFRYSPGIPPDEIVEFIRSRAQ